MNGLKIMCMNMEHIVFQDSVSFLPCPLRKLTEAFGLTAFKSWYPHYCSTEKNLDYLGPIPEVSFYGFNEWERRRGGSFSRATRSRNLGLFSKTDASWKITFTMTSQY